MKRDALRKRQPVQITEQWRGRRRRDADADHDAGSVAKDLRYREERGSVQEPNPEGRRTAQDQR